MDEKEIPLEPGLYVTATPIGNLGDITYRAVNIMKSADLILCEDTRQTAKLLAAYHVKTPLDAYHEHNAEAMRPRILEKLANGARICLVSDAGTPLISDPGYKLVRAARDAGARVYPAPGPSALIAALCAAGVPTDQFHFAGFPPAKRSARAKFFERLADVPGALVFYEAGRRIADCLEEMKDVFGDRRCVIARELTKLHEEFIEDDLSSLAERFRDAPPKGEIVVMLHPITDQKIDPSEIDDFLADALQHLSVKDAAAAAVLELGVSRNLAYQRALALSKSQ